MKIRILLLLFLLSLATCATPPSPMPPSVVVTLPPYAHFVRKIAGDRVRISLLVPPGSNPHVYEPSPKEAERILKADIWFRMGDPSEDKLFRFLQERTSQLHILDLTQGISPLPSHEEHTSPEGRDLHMWLSPKLAQQQVKTILHALSEVYPHYRSEFEERTERFLAELQTLDVALRTMLSPFRGKTILVSHPAFAYFCDEFHLHQLSLEWEGKDPLPRDIAHTLEEAKNRKVACVFTQPQYSDKGVLLIARHLKIPSYQIDPYSEEYVANLTRFAELITSHGN